VRMIVKMLVAFFLFFPRVIFSLTIGSDTTFSIEPYAILPAVDTTANTIKSLAFMKNGFELASSTTNCIFKSAFPLTGPVHLRGGEINLDTDLIFHNITNLQTSGFFMATITPLTFAQALPGYQLLQLLFSKMLAFI